MCEKQHSLNDHHFPAHKYRFFQSFSFSLATLYIFTNYNCYKHMFFQFFIISFENVINGFFFNIMCEKQYSSNDHYFSAHKYRLFQPFSFSLVTLYIFTNNNCYKHVFSIFYYFI